MVSDGSMKTKHKGSALELDSFGKLPAGIMEMAVISPGSYIECKELVAPYETHYCYAAITFSNLVSICVKSHSEDSDFPIESVC